MPWINLLGNDIHYTDTGSGQPVVLVHGHGSTAACWEPIIEELKGDFRVLAYDSYDHGFSENSRREGPMTDRAAELESFIDGLGLERPIIIGQSMGGMTTLRWAIRHPNEAAALVSCGMAWPIKVPMPGEAGQKNAIASALDLEEQIWLGVGASFTQDWIDAHPVEHARYIRIRSTAAAIEAARHPRNLKASLGEFASSDPADVNRMREGLSAVTSPLMVFVGSEEVPAILESAAETASLVPNTRLVVVDGAAHNAYYQRQALLLENLRELLARASVEV
jgi:pimeloyl-ACP methyl ester carboxylesterase